MRVLGLRVLGFREYLEVHETYYLPVTDLIETLNLLPRPEPRSFQLS